MKNYTEAAMHNLYNTLGRINIFTIYCGQQKNNKIYI